MRTFRVNVVGFNADTFRERYSEYIKSEHEVYFENVEFELQAPQEIYDEIDNLRDELIQRNIRDPFTYGAWCEKNFERNLREDYERKTTYTSDFSIAEWCVPG